MDAAANGIPAHGPTVLLIGNPNVGKSVVFGRLTGRYATVANYPGTTIEVARGRAKGLAGKPTLVDTPGTNSLTPQSEDEKVARDILLAEPGAAVIQVGDTKNLRRTLYLTLQLAELGRRQILVLNLQDEARDLGIRVDARRLEQLLGIPVLPATATLGAGLEAIPRRLASAGVARFQPVYPPPVEEAVEKVCALLPAELGEGRRGVALMLLSGDRTLAGWLEANVPAPARAALGSVRSELDRLLGASAAGVISRARHRFVARLLRQVFTADRAVRGSLRDRLGMLAMHPIWGVPVLLAVLAAAYVFVGWFGAGVVVDAVEEGVFGRYLNPTATVLVQRFVPWGWLRDLLVGPYGIVTMALTYALAIVLPVVGTFFIFFGVLEDSGYLPRLAVMVNRPFAALGLSGKAVLPMVLGLGCDTMATLTARILPTRKERIIVTLLLALGVPCSAQLGVILALLGSVSPLGTLLWAGVVLATLVGVGWAAARVVPGRSADFVLEVPPLRWPRLANLAVKTVARAEWYLWEAVPLFLAGTLLLFLLDRTGLLLHLQHAARPVVVGLLDLPPEAANSFLVGFLRRDYGAAGFFTLRQQGLLDGVQTVVSLVVITLFVPCIANFFMMVKERGLAVASAMVAFIVPTAFLTGAALNALLRLLKVSL